MIGLPIHQRQGQDRPIRGISALIRKATVCELPPGRKRLCLWMRLLELAGVLLPYRWVIPARECITERGHDLRDGTSEPRRG